MSENHAARSCRQRSKVRGHTRGAALGREQPSRRVALLVVFFFLLAGPVAGQMRDIAIPPGINFGGSVGPTMFRGSGNGPIPGAAGWEFFVGGGLANGLYGRLGALLSGHDVAPDTPDYQFLTLFLEPRYVFLGLSRNVAPYVAGRAGWTYEKVLGGSYNLKANGSLLAAGGGVLIRVAPQIALEFGVLLGKARFGDYTFKGEYAWKLCLDDLQPGTALPVSVADCAGSRSIGNVIRLCYPPYYAEGETGDCEPPDIPYDGTSRTGDLVRVSVGVNLSVSTMLRR